MAGVAATVATDLATPDSHKGTGVAVGASPGEDVAVGSLDNGEGVTGALVGHGVWLCMSGWRLNRLVGRVQTETKQVDTVGEAW